MSIKKTIRLTDESEQLCKLLSEHHALNYSRSVNKIAERYNVMTINALATLNLDQQEKLAICQCYNGYMKPESIVHCIAGLEFTTSEGWTWDENVKELLGYDENKIKSLLEKIRSWNQIQKIACIDMTERYWNQNTPHYEEEPEEE